MRTTIPNGSTVAFSGFTSAGAAKHVPSQLKDHTGLRVIAGASAGDLDNELCEAIAWRAPYQSSSKLRQRIRHGQAEFVDLHLSQVPRKVRNGDLGRIDFAVIEAAACYPSGLIAPTRSAGASQAFLDVADQVIIEVNRSVRVHNMADFPDTNKAYNYPSHPMERVGSSFMRVDPDKVVEVINTNQNDAHTRFKKASSVVESIGMNVANFLAREFDARQLVIQSGVGSVANCVLEEIGFNTDIQPFYMYTEVAQPTALTLLNHGRIKGISTCALTVNPDMYGLIDELQDRIVLRPQDVSNSPAVIEHLNVVAINTALQADVTGHVNSTYSEKGIVNGIGGSGDFARNASLSIFALPSEHNGVKSIVECVRHVDHSEHSVQVLVTEKGVADLRGLSPAARERVIRTIA